MLSVGMAVHKELFRFVCDKCNSVFPAPSDASFVICSCGKRFEKPKVAPVTFTLSPSASTPPITQNQWNWVHSWLSDTSTIWNPSEAELIYNSEFVPKIPSNGCSCNLHWSNYVATNPIDWSTREAARNYFFNAHNFVSANYSNKPTMVWSDYLRRFRFPKGDRGKLQPIITWDEFTRDTLALSQQILDRYPDVSGIAGCPRSGMRAATDIAIRLGVPLYEASAANGLRECSSGLRLRNEQLHGQKQTQNGPVVIVEDSACSGHSIRELRKHPDLVNNPIFAVYVDDPSLSLVEGFAVYLTLPHWFDWNIWGNGQILRDFRVGTDWDGVLNEDCPVECDDDGQRYIEWMQACKPIRSPRAYNIPFIVTARREAYRAICEQWLARYKINYGKLVMFPGTFEERSRTCIGTWKAAQCDANGVGLFIESDLTQARIISQLRSPQGHLTLHIN